MAIKTIQSDKAPQPIGPYSQAVAVDNMIFTSGQIAINPLNGQLFGGTAGEQTKLVFENLKAVLEAAGSGFDRVIKATIYLKNMSDFAEVNEVYATYFKDPLPARSTVEVSRLPKDVLVEIDCIAIK